MNENMLLTLAKEITCDEKERIEYLLADNEGGLGEKAIPFPNNVICSELLNIANVKCYSRKECAVQVPLIKKYYRLQDSLVRRVGIQLNLFPRRLELEDVYYDLGQSFEMKKQLFRRLQIMLRIGKGMDNIDEHTIFDEMSKLLYKLSNESNFDGTDAELLNVYSLFIASVNSLERDQRLVNRRKQEWQKNLTPCEKLINACEGGKVIIDVQNLLCNNSYLLGRYYACYDDCSKFTDYLVQSFFKMHIDVYFANKNMWIEKLKHLITDDKIKISEHGALLFK